MNIIFDCGNSNRPPTTGLKTFMNLDSSKPHYNFFEKINDVDSLKQWIDAFLNEKYQNTLLINDEIRYIYCIFVIIDEFYQIHKETYYADTRLFSRIIATGGLYPDTKYYKKEFHPKIKEFLEDKFPDQIMCFKYFIAYIQNNQISNAYEILLNIIKFNRKESIDILNFSEIEFLKKSLLEDNQFIELYQKSLDSYSFNVNKQGVTGKTVFLQDLPTNITMKQSHQVQKFFIDDVRISAGLLYGMSMPFVDFSFEKISPTNVLKFVSRMAKVMYQYKVYDDLEIAFNDCFQKYISISNNKVNFCYKQKKGVLIMNSNWFLIGKELSRMIWVMHKDKDTKSRKKAIASTKKELCNSLINKKPSKRSMLIWNKYMQKFNISSLFSATEGLDKMSDIDLKEFNIGLYVTEEKNDETN